MQAKQNGRGEDRGGAVQRTPSRMVHILRRNCQHLLGCRDFAHGDNARRSTHAKNARVRNSGPLRPMCRDTVRAADFPHRFQRKAAWTIWP